MAKATVLTEKVTKTIEVEEPYVLLKLTEKEAKVLLAVTGSIEGDRTKSGRALTDNVFYELLEHFQPFNINRVGCEGTIKRKTKLL